MDIWSLKPDFEGHQRVVYILFTGEKLQLSTSMNIKFWAASSSSLFRIKYINVNTK